MVQLSHPYMTTGKTIVLTRQTFVGKVMSLHEHFFYILDLRPLLDICVVNMFFKFMACLFILFVVFFDKQSS